MAQPRFPSSLLWAGQRRMRPGTPSSRGGRSFALSVGGCVVSPVHAIRSLRSLRRGKNAFKLLQIGDHRDLLAFFVSPPPTPSSTLDFSSSHSHFFLAPPKSLRYHLRSLSWAPLILPSCLTFYSALGLHPKVV